jgi:hypothetical protein
MANTTTQAS